MSAEKVSDHAQMALLQSLLEVKTCVTGKNIKFTLFVPPKRASIGKLIATTREEGEEGWLVCIDNVAVNRKFRGNGFGAYLLQLCYAYFEQRNMHHFALEAEEDMARYGKLVAFYEVNGFKVRRPQAQHRLLYNGDQTLRVVEMRRISASSQRSVPAALSCDHLLNTPEFAAKMCEEATVCTRSRMSMKDALLMADSLCPGVIANGVSLATALEEEGHPEWLQVLGLIYAVGVVQAAFAWETPVVDTSLAFVKKVKLPKWATTKETGPWSNFSYLGAILGTRMDNRSGSQLPREALSVFGEEPVGQNFWKSMLFQCAETCESPAPSSLGDVHLRMLDMYFPELISW